MNAVIYEAEYDGLNRRLDTIDRTLAWLEAKGRRWSGAARRLAAEKTDLLRRQLQIEDLTGYDDLD